VWKISSPKHIFVSIWKASVLCRQAGWARSSMRHGLAKKRLISPTLPQCCLQRSGTGLEQTKAVRNCSDDEKHGGKRKKARGKPAPGQRRETGRGIENAGLSGDLARNLAESIAPEEQCWLRGTKFAELRIATTKTCMMKKKRKQCPQSRRRQAVRNNSAEGNLHADK
jgi:hypothetical protein